LHEIHRGHIFELAVETEHSEATFHSYSATLREHGSVGKWGCTYGISFKFVDFGEYAKHDIPSTNSSDGEGEGDGLAAKTSEVANFVIEEYSFDVLLYKF
jgi:DNA-binding IclR family transcriptional regulator